MPDKKDEKNEKTVADLASQLDEMFGLVKEQKAQIDEFGETKEALGKKIEESDARIVELSEAVTAEKERSDELEKKFGRPGTPGDDEFKSVGQQFTDSEQYSGMVARKSRSSDPVLVKSLLSPRSMALAVKTLSSDPTSAGALVDPMRVAEIIVPPERAFRIRDLLNVDTTGSNSIEYVEETGFANLYTVLTADASATDTDIVVESVSGLYPGQNINVGGEAHVIAAAGIDPDTKTVTMTVGLTSDKDTGDAVTSGQFAPTAETVAKPQMSLNYTLKDTSVKTLAHWIPASRQILADAGQLRGQIDGRLIYGLMLTEEEQLLYGDGTGENLLGILTNPAVQSYLWSSGKVGDTFIDAIRRAMTLSRIAEYPNTGVIVHPTDWEEIELLKGSDKHYIWLIVGDGVNQRMFRVPVIDTTAIRVSEFATGAFALGATVYDREEASVRIAEQHEDFFVRNMVAILAEQREALANFRPEAFVYGKFDSAPT